MNDKRFSQANTDKTYGIYGSMYRGFYPIYDALLKDFEVTTNNICEVGIGFANSQLIWKYIFGPDSNVVGIDIGSPVEEFSGNEGDTIRYEINLEGLRNYINAPLQNTKNLHLIWDKNGYSPDVVKEIVNVYGLFDWVVNDAWQRGEAYKLMTPWKDAITETGIIIQEKIGREPDSKINQMRMQQALDEGWLIYDVRQYTNLDTQPLAGNADAEGYIGIWSNNQSRIKDKLKEYDHLLLQDADHIHPDDIDNCYRRTPYDKD